MKTGYQSSRAEALIGWTNSSGPKIPIPNWFCSLLKCWLTQKAMVCERVTSPVTFRVIVSPEELEVTRRMLTTFPPPGGTTVEEATAAMSYLALFDIVQ